MCSSVLPPSLVNLVTYSILTHAENIATAYGLGLFCLNITGFFKWVSVFIPVFFMLLYANMNDSVLLRILFNYNSLLNLYTLYFLFVFYFCNPYLQMQGINFNITSIVSHWMCFCGGKQSWICALGEKGYQTCNTWDSLWTHTMLRLWRGC